jgi:hypothetical protein
MALAIVMATTPTTFGAQLFTYVIDFKVAVRGRDMQSGNGNFCNTFTATFVQKPAQDPNIWIQLMEPPFDNAVGIKVSYSTNGAPHVFCWTGFLPNHTYFFKYTKKNNGFIVQGNGKVTN